MAIDLFASNLSFDEIKAFLENHKKLNITVRRAPHHSPQSKAPAAVADKYVASLAFNPIGGAWREISAAEALKILTSMLSVSMAYNISLLGSTLAKQVATRLISQFQSDSTHYLTNTQLQTQGNALSWTPVTESTFDSAVVIYNREYIGIICIEDED